MRPVRLHALALLAALAVGACGARFEVDGGRAHARVVKQVGFGPRVPGTAAHAAMRTWLEAELRRLGGRVETPVAVDSSLGRPLEIHNLIARWGPAGRRRIVLCAHYDSRPWSDQESDPARRQQPVPGANDGGSGVAVLLEVAELMHRQSPAVEVELAFFDAEDLGRPTRPEEFSLGARAYARALPPRGDASRPVAAFLFDMVGDRDLAIHPEVRSAREATNLVSLVLAGARATGARGFRPEPRYEVTDDHTPLLDAGLPAVDIIDFDYPAWHTLRDTPEQVSAESLAEVARVAAWLVYASPLARP